MFATVVPAKGPAKPWIAKRCAQWIDSLGRGKILLKTDGERAIVRLARDIKGQKIDTGETMLEHPEA
eukprot:8676410-Heterocapsa_arctica.AAC.1